MKGRRDADHYNSCRNRHCPKCQGQARAKWVADRQAELLPVPYFHIVFTLPAPIAEIAFQNKAVVYAILFKAAADAMTALAASRPSKASHLTNTSRRGLNEAAIAAREARSRNWPPV